jgi:hypothetical protein
MILLTGRPPFLLNLFIALLNRPLSRPVNAGHDDGRNVTGAQEQPICQKQDGFNAPKLLMK